MRGPRLHQPLRHHRESLLHQTWKIVNGQSTTRAPGVPLPASKACGLVHGRLTLGNKGGHVPMGHWRRVPPNPAIRSDLGGLPRQCTAHANFEQEHLGAPTPTYRRREDGRSSPQATRLESAVQKSPSGQAAPAAGALKFSLADSVAKRRTRSGSRTLGCGRPPKQVELFRRPNHGDFTLGPVL
jgi:hypothetical protein